MYVHSTAHVHLHKYELELDALNKFQVLLTLMCFGVFPPVLTICVLSHAFESKVILPYKD